MVSIDDIKEYLDTKKINYVSEVRLRPSDETIMLYLTQDKVASKVSSKVTSIRQLDNLKKKLTAEFSKNVEVILMKDEAQQELESGFFQMLNRKFDDQIVSLYISFRNESVVDVFFEVSNLTAQLEGEITKYLKTILNDTNFLLGSIDWLSSPSDLPTLPALLRALKILQPINLQALTIVMQETYRSVSDKWLSHKLDQLRKKGFVIWQKNSETYAITGKGLAVVPAGTKRTSSDIERALALWRRKW